MKPNGVHLLLVEDNEGDILLTSEALEGNDCIERITIARNGQEAIDLMERQSSPYCQELPDIVLLDINLPLKNGHEVLMHIKKSPKTRHIPVIMLTTSNSPRDIQRSYQCYANSYVTKPMNLYQFYDVLNEIQNYWIKLSALPKFLTHDER